MNKVDEYLGKIENSFIAIPKSKREKLWNNIFFFVVTILVVIETIFILYLNLTGKDLLYGLIGFLICSTIIMLLFYINKRYYTKKFYRVKDAYKKINLIKCNDELLDNMYHNATLVMIARPNNRYLNFIYNWLNNNNLVNNNLNVYHFEAKDLKDKFYYNYLDDNTYFLAVLLSDLMLNDDNILNFRNDLNILGIRYLNEMIDNKK